MNGRRKQTTAFSLFGPVVQWGMTKAQLEEMKKEILVQLCGAISNALDELGGENIDEP